MGGRGGSSMTTARNVANALGIARQDVQRMMAQQKIEPPPNYPKVQRDPHPLEMSPDMIYVSRLKMELDQRLRDSQFFIEAENEDQIKRYLDKYSIIEREKLEADMQCLPEELSWKKKKLKDGRNGEGETKAKKRKLAADDTIINEKLRKLEEKEGNDDTQIENDDEKANKKDEDSGSEKSGGEDGENQLSDDDYQEEDNDYISNYFDNGEGYGDAGSDDNMDGDEY